MQGRRRGVAEGPPRRVPAVRRGARGAAPEDAVGQRVGLPNPTPLPLDMYLALHGFSLLAAPRAPSRSTGGAVRRVPVRLRVALGVAGDAGVS
jgi:hypothetical protein